MKKLFLVMSLSVIIIFNEGCTEEEDLLLTSLAGCETNTDFYGKMLLGQELICWNNDYPYQIGSGGTGNCGEGYEYVENPFMSLGMSLEAYDTEEAEYTSLDKIINIEIRFACEGFSTQEKFYDLISVDQYSFAESYEDFGKFIVKYQKDGETYSSLLADNSQSYVEIRDIVPIKPQFTTEPNGNNGLPASMDIQINFSGQLSNEAGDIIAIKNAEVRGKVYRQSPWGYYWEDWGKGWNE